MATYEHAWGQSWGRPQKQWPGNLLKRSDFTFQNRVMGETWWNWTLWQPIVFDDSFQNFSGSIGSNNGTRSWFQTHKKLEIWRKLGCFSWNGWISLQNLAKLLKTDLDQSRQHAPALLKIWRESMVTCQLLSKAPGSGRSRSSLATLLLLTLLL